MSTAAIVYDRNTGDVLYKVQGELIQLNVNVDVDRTWREVPHDTEPNDAPSLGDIDTHHPGLVDPYVNN